MSQDDLPPGVTPIRPGKPLPISQGPLVPWYTLLWWRLREWITWPWQARQLRKAGFVRRGWRHWEWPGGD